MLAPSRGRRRKFIRRRKPSLLDKPVDHRLPQPRPPLYFVELDEAIRRLNCAHMPAAYAREMAPSPTRRVGTFAGIKFEIGVEASRTSARRWSWNRKLIRPAFGNCGEVIRARSDTRTCALKVSISAKELLPRAALVAPDEVYLGQLLPKRNGANERSLA